MILRFVALETKLASVPMFAVVYTISCPTAWVLKITVGRVIWGWNEVLFPPFLHPLCWSLPAAVSFFATRLAGGKNDWRSAIAIALLTSIGHALLVGATWPVWLRGGPPMEVRWSMFLQALHVDVIFLPLSIPTAKLSLNFLEWLGSKWKKQ